MRKIKFTYTGDPSKNPRDAVRWFVGDTNERRPLVDDREIDFELALNPNTQIAASNVAIALAGKLALEADEIEIDDVRKEMREASKRLLTHAAKLKEEACKFAAPSFPAVFRADKCAIKEDETLTGSRIGVGQFDNPWAVQFNNILDRAQFNGF